MKIKFCGAAKMVTGSCHLIEYANKKLLVDCGMRQGQDTKTELGEDSFPFDAASVDAVLLTHAHIDHSGLLPLLVKKGFSGDIITTEATSQLCTIMLPDSANIQEYDAQLENKKRQRAGKKLIEPLYTMQDVNNTLKLIKGVKYDETVKLSDEVTVRFKDAGHLLGSASVEIWITEEGVTKTFAFSGDIGRAERPIICDPKFIEQADYVIMESTYGDRNHEAGTNDEKEAQLASVLRAAIARGGNIVIPSFAIGRTQELLYYIKRFIANNTVKGLEKIPVYVDSPLGIEATRVYERSADGYYDEEAMELRREGSPFDFETVNFTRTADESKLINVTPGQKIIIASSGMCDAGRIRHHLKHNLYQKNATVIFAGYQAVGTLGRLLVDGAEKVKLFGEEIRVNAVIEHLSVFSGHAGRNELVDWVSAITPKPDRVFLVHGEEEALDMLAGAIRSLGYNVTVPNLLDEVVLTDGRKDGEQEAPAVQAPAADVESVEELTHEYKLVEQMERILKLAEEMSFKKSPDVSLKLDIMENDLAAFADKWEKTFE